MTKFSAELERAQKRSTCGCNCASNEPLVGTNTSPHPALRAKSLPDRAHLIGYVGPLRAQDGLDLAIHAMTELVHGQGRCDLQCAILGAGPELENLATLSAALGLADYVTFADHLHGAALARAVANFDVGVLPAPAGIIAPRPGQSAPGSSSAPRRASPAALVTPYQKQMLNYMALGVPFVSFDRAGVRPVAGDAALLAMGDCPLELAGALCAVLDDQSFRARLSQNGRRRTAQLTQTDMAMI